MANLAGDESLTDIVDIGTFWPDRDCHDYVASALLDGLSVDSVTIVEFCEEQEQRRMIDVGPASGNGDQT